MFQKLVQKNNSNRFENKIIRNKKNLFFFKLKAFGNLF